MPLEMVNVPVMLYFLGILALMSAIGTLTWAVNALLGQDVLISLLCLLGTVSALCIGSHLLKAATRGRNP